MKIWVRDYQEEGKAQEDRDKHNAYVVTCPPGWTPDVCYRQIDSEGLYFDNSGNIQYKGGCCR